jgi:hypothetical protein
MILFSMRKFERKYPNQRFTILFASGARLVLLTFYSGAHEAPLTWAFFRLHAPASNPFKCVGAKWEELEPLQSSDYARMHLNVRANNNGQKRLNGN